MMTNYTWVAINHTDKCYALHTTKAGATRAAKALRAMGTYSTIFPVADANRFGALLGLRDVTWHDGIEPSDDQLDAMGL